MKNIKILTITLIAFLIGMTINNFAMSDVPSNFRVAIVDVQKIVSQSTQVDSLRQERQQKNQELADMLKKAKEDLANETDVKKKKSLELKYEKELKAKKASNDANYEKKLNEIDKNIKSTIAAQAKKENYNLVLAKGVVLAGGDDITDELTKLIK